MAKVKILDNKVVIKSEILKDDVLDIVAALAPSAAVLRDPETNEAIYTVCKNENNTYSNYGACFKDGKSIGAIPDDVMQLEPTAKKNKITLMITAILRKLNAIEENIADFIEDVPEFKDDIEFMDEDEDEIASKRGKK